MNKEQKRRNEKRKFKRNLKLFFNSFFFWMMIYVFAVGIFSAACLFGLSEKVFASVEVIKIHDNTMTEAKREENLAAYYARQEKAKMFYAGEISRQHQKEIEVLKYQNALMLERAGASRIEISAFNVSSKTQVSNIQKVKS